MVKINKYKMKKDIPEKFWEEYEKSDMIKREEKLKVIVNNIDKLFELKDKKLRKHVLKLALMGYFDDLINYAHIKNIKKGDH